MENLKKFLGLLKRIGSAVTAICGAIRACLEVLEEISEWKRRHQTTTVVA